MNDATHIHIITVENVVDKYYAGLIFFAQKLLNSKEVAEEITDDVFVKLWKKQPDFSQYKNIKAILYISVKNACLNYIQQQKRTAAKQYALAYYKQSESEDFILNQITRAEVLGAIYEELEKLPIEQRRVMHLLFKEGLDSKQVAEQLNISVHTVKKHKLNGIKALRKKFRFAVKLLLIILMT